MPQAIQVALAMAFPARMEMRGVNRTLVCVKKLARADPVDKRPTFNNPCAKAFQMANSSPASNNGVHDHGEDEWDRGCGGGDCCMDLFLGRKKRGKKQTDAIQPRVALIAVADGGIGSW